jgi:hypothetical protein
VFKWLLEQVRAAQLDRQVLQRDEALALVDRLLSRGDAGAGPTVAN